MADVSIYLVLGMLIAPPILRQARQLVTSVRTPTQRDPALPPPPRFLSRARLTPFTTPFTAAVSVTTLLLVLISLRNLVSVQYGFDVFIPVSIVRRLRQLSELLSPATSAHSSISSAPLPMHIETFRGGYKPDLFLAYNAPITVPTSTLRDLINASPSLLPMGLRTKPKLAELQALISRLSSFEGRRMYLLLGSKPMVDCTFCRSPSDHFWYAVPFLLGIYAWRILALGLLTTHPDDSVAMAIRQLGSLLGLARPHTSHSGQRQYEADRSKWRTSSLGVLLGSLAVELMIMYELGQVSGESSRLNHWHSNLHILRQVLFLPLILVVYLLPAARPTDNFAQSMLHLNKAQQSLQNLMHVSELTDVTRTVIVEDDQLLDVTRQWKATDDETVGPAKAEGIIGTARVHGGDVATQAIAQAQQGIRSVTHRWWKTTDQLNRSTNSSTSAASLAPTHTSSSS